MMLEDRVYRCGGCGRRVHMLQRPGAHRRVYWLLGCPRCGFVRGAPVRRLHRLVSWDPWGVGVPETRAPLEVAR